MGTLAARALQPLRHVTSVARGRSWGCPPSLLWVPADPKLRVSLPLAVAVGLAVGFLTAYGQGWLGDSTGSLANSAGPWSVPTFLVAVYVRRVLPAIAAAVVTLACSEIGYVIATEIRGGSSSTRTIVFWLTASLLAGPPLGVAGAWARRGGLLGGIGFAVIAGVLIGEGWYGWTTVADTTDWRYWAVELSLGVAAVVALAVRARRRPAEVAAVLGMAGAAAVVVFAAGRLAS